MPFCHTCLGAALRMSHEAVRKAVTALRLQPEFTVLVGKQCSLCQEQRVTVQAGEESESGTRRAERLRLLGR
jgi:hypothetical protein